MHEGHFGASEFNNLPLEDNRGDLFDERTAARRQVRGIFLPLCDIVGEELNTTFADTSPETETPLRIDKLPFGNVYAILPSILFEKLDRDKIKTSEPSIDLYAGGIGWADDLMFSLIHNSLKSGELINPKEYEAYERVYEWHKQNGTSDVLEESARFRAGNTRPMDNLAATGKFTHFLIARTDVDEHAHPVVQNVTVPIGEYGDEFAEYLLRHTVSSIEAIEAMDDAEFEAILSQGDNTRIVTLYTARGNDAHWLSSEGRTDGDVRSLKDSIQESMVTIMQVIVQLTAEKVEGYEDPHKLLQDILSNDLINAFTAGMGMTQIGPLSVEGRYFPRPLVKNEPHLEIRGGVTSAIKEAKRRYAAAAIAQFADLTERDSEMFRGALALPCPALGHGITVLSEALYERGK